MKHLLFAVAALISITASAQTQMTEGSSKYYYGQVAQLIFSAMKGAGAQPTCEENNCKFVIKNFESYEETDGCGGGTTGYGISFNLADGKLQEVKSCSNGNADFNGIAGSGLAEIFGDLDLNKTSGWVSSIRVAKVECVTNKAKNQKVGSIANCKITSAAE